MAIDPATIVWDDAPQQRDIPSAQTQSGGIDPSTVIWDDAPITDLPQVNALPPDFSQVSATVDSTAAGRQADGWMPGVGRDLAYGARSVLQGAGGLLGAIGGDALGALETKITGRPVASFRDNAAALADRIGLPQAQTSGDRVLGDVGEALTGTGLTLGIGGGINALANLGRGAAAPATNQLAQFLTSQPVMQAASAAGGAGASSVARESGASQGNQLLAGLAGSLGPGALATGAGAALRGAVRGTSGEQMRNTLADFERLGATPSVGQASGNRMVQGVENLLAGGPTSAGVMNRFATRQGEDIGDGLQNLAGQFSRNPSAERAGRAIERGVDTFNKNVGATRRALYWQADQFIPDTTPTPMQNTLREAVALTTPDPQAAATTGGLIQPGIAALRQNLEADLAANGGQLTYGALRRIRSDIGEQIGRASPLNPPADIRELNRLYGALSEDMRATARSQGPEAVAAANRANNYTRASAERLEAMSRVVEKVGGPEKVYSAVMSGTRDGGTTLRSVMQSLPPDGQRAVTSAVIRRMGLANPGAQDATGEAFSAATFLTNWNRVSPEAKRALFDRHGPSFSRSMDRIASVADNIKSGSQVFANPSGTANRGAAMSYAIGLPLSIAQAPVTGHYWPVIATIGGGVAANVAARAMTSPLVVNWLANSTKLPLGAINASIQQLARAAEKSGDEAAIEYAAALASQQPESAPDQGSNGQQRQRAGTP
jgi:hypothetical protein